MGVRDAGIRNAIVTLVKMIPLVLIILGAFAFKSELFLVPDWTSTLASNGNSTTPFAQVRGAMGTILWVLSRC